MPVNVNSNPVILRVEDSFGNPISGASVSFNLTLPTGVADNSSLSVTSANSDGGGEIMTQLLAVSDTGNYAIAVALNGMPTIAAQVMLGVTGALPSLGAGQAVDAAGNTLTTDAMFAGGASLDGETWVTPLTAQANDTVRILGRIQTDTGHIGNIVELLAYVNYQPAQGDMQFFMLGTNNDLQPWDGNPATLTAFGQSVVLPPGYLVDIFGDTLTLVGEWTVFFGYRLDDGTVISNTSGIVIQVE